MRYTFPSASALALILACPAAIAAQEVETEDRPATRTIEEDGTIVVRAERLRGQLLVDDPPVLELDAEAIAALGAGSIDELLQAIEPATGSARGRGGGRPIFLVNGVRIGSFREFRSYPPEAIAKVEVFNEEVAQRFGFSPDQRVVNFVLKNDFTAREIEVEYEQPGSGGYRATQQEATLLTIQNGGRINAQVEANQRTLLTEAERDLPLVSGAPSDVASDPDPRAFRSLISRLESYQAEASYAKAFLESGTSISANLTASHSDTLALSGLDTVLLADPAGESALRVFGQDDPLERRVRSASVATSGSLNRPVGGWNLTATYDAGWARTRTQVDRFADTTALRDAALAGTLDIVGALPAVPDAGFDTARSTLWNASTLATLRGSPLLLPGGEVTATFDLGYDWGRIESSDTRGAADTRLTRGDLSGGLNLNVPVTSRREGFADAIGSITLNGQAGFNRLSDFGTLTDWTLGVSWAPTDRLTLSASRIRREVAPGLSALGDPQITALNIPLFDFATGDTVLATVISGGNPNLVAETQTDWKLSANYRLPFIDNTRLQVDYTANRSRDVTSSFPTLTPSFEAAFPDRVERDGTGRLIALDRRAITLFETRSRTLSINLNTSGLIGKRPESGGEGRGGPSAQSPTPAASGPVTMSGGAFAQARERLCSTPEGETPDLSGLPEGLLDRLRDENGNIPPERIAQLRQRFCGENAGEGEGGGPPGMDSERFAALRTALCADPPDLAALPERMRARLTGDNGEIDPERLARLRTRICENGEGESADEAGSGERRGGSSTGRRGGGGAAFFGGNRDPRPRYFLSLSQTFALQNEVTPSLGSPTLDQLDGFVIGSNALPDYSARLEGGLFFQGYGLRLSGRYLGSAQLRGNGLPGSDDLFFSDLATFNLRLFADMGRVLGKEDGILKGVRISMRADNIFDAQRRITDESGIVPDEFLPDRIDPTGRYLGIELRKLF